MIETMLCKSCHYPLKHLPEPRCPECGRAFDPLDPSSFDTLSTARDSALRRSHRWVLIAAMVCVLILGGWLHVSKAVAIWSGIGLSIVMMLVYRLWLNRKIKSP